MLISSRYGSYLSYTKPNSLAYVPRDLESHKYLGNFLVFGKNQSHDLYDFLDFMLRNNLSWWPTEVLLPNQNWCEDISQYLCKYLNKVVRFLHSQESKRAKLSLVQVEIFFWRHEENYVTDSFCRVWHVACYKRCKKRTEVDHLVNVNFYRI